MVNITVNLIERKEIHNNKMASDLPTEAWWAIMLQLPYETLLDQCKVSSPYASICRDGDFWREKMRRDYPEIELKDPTTISYKEQYRKTYQARTCEKHYPLKDCINAAARMNDITRLRRYFATIPVYRLLDDVHPDVFNNSKALELFLDRIGNNDLATFVASLIDKYVIQVENHVKNFLANSNYLDELLRKRPVPGKFFELCALAERFDLIYEYMDDASYSELTSMIIILSHTYDAHYPDVDNKRLIVIGDLIDVIKEETQAKGEDEEYYEFLNEMLIKTIMSRLPRDIWQIYVEKRATNLEQAYIALVRSLSNEDIENENYVVPRQRVYSEDLDYLLMEIWLQYKGKAPSDIRDMRALENQMIAYQTLSPDVYAIYIYFLEHGTFPSHQEPQNEAEAEDFYYSGYRD